MIILLLQAMSLLELSFRPTTSIPQRFLKIWSFRSKRGFWHCFGSTDRFFDTLCSSKPIFHWRKAKSGSTFWHFHTCCFRFGSLTQVRGQLFQLCKAWTFFNNIRSSKVDWVWAEEFSVICSCHIICTAHRIFHLYWLLGNLLYIKNTKVNN